MVSPVNTSGSLRKRLRCVRLVFKGARFFRRTVNVDGADAQNFRMALRNKRIALGHVRRQNGSQLNCANAACVRRHWSPTCLCIIFLARASASSKTKRACGGGVGCGLFQVVGIFFADARLNKRSLSKPDQVEQNGNNDSINRVYYSLASSICIQSAAAAEGKPSTRGTCRRRAVSSHAARH